jgi:hypothetical protein
VSVKVVQVLKRSGTGIWGRKVGLKVMQVLKGSGFEK